MRLFRLVEIFLLPLLLFLVNGYELQLEELDQFELDATLPTVVCRQCIQMWRIAAPKQNIACGPQANTCYGNVCFMRQCKHCPVYQYMAGCLTLTSWQMQDLQVARRRNDLLSTRIGAALLCEDTANQTTCICNRRDKCNDIHTRTPFSTYTSELFGGIINFDIEIGRIDPRYLDVMRLRNPFSGYLYAAVSGRSSGPALIMWLVLVGYCYCVLVNH